ncbi:MAG: helix-hairpin-helix domain-containing protein [Bacteroidetes bacterium]|nr:helix-hairpin-helix domain-containing protein [Bacteroidota bacterium]
MKPTQIIKDYLNLSRSEQRGVVVLLFILLTVNTIRMMIPGEWKLDPVDFTTFNKEIMAFEQSLKRARADEISAQKTDNQKSGYKKSISGSSNEQSQQSKKPAFVIELNSADTFDLQRLRGIGPSFARRITGYRARLGGYERKEQLLEVYGMDSSRFQGIKRYVSVNPDRITKLNLNTATFKELIRHPYMPYDVAKEIAVYRKKKKGIKVMEEVQGMKSLDSITFVKLRPYLSIK